MFAAYYGKTTMNLLVRCNEHLGANKSDCKLAAPSPSSIRDHFKQTGHIASIDDFCIISKTDNSYDLPTLAKIKVVLAVPSRTINFLKKKFSVTVMDKKCLFFLAHFIEIIHLLNNVTRYGIS